MAKAITQKYKEMVLEISDDGTTWSRICGITDVTVSRAASLDTTEVPDCDDEDLPFDVNKEVRSIEVSASGTGVWAQTSHQKMLDWFYGATEKHVRVGNLNAAIGDTEYETGKAFLTQLDNARTKGQVVSAEISVEFNGTPERAAKA